MGIGGRDGPAKHRADALRAERVHPSPRSSSCSLRGRSGARPTDGLSCRPSPQRTLGEAFAVRAVEELGGSRRAPVREPGVDRHYRPRAVSGGSARGRAPCGVPGQGRGRQGRSPGGIRRHRREIDAALDNGPRADQAHQHQAAGVTPLGLRLRLPRGADGPGRARSRRSPTLAVRPNPHVMTHGSSRRTRSRRPARRHAVR